MTEILNLRFLKVADHREKFLWIEIAQEKFLKFQGLSPFSYFCGNTLRVLLRSDVWGTFTPTNTTFDELFIHLD